MCIFFLIITTTTKTTFIFIVYTMGLRLIRTLNRRNVFFFIHIEMHRPNELSFGVVLPPSTVQKNHESRFDLAIA